MKVPIGEVTWIHVLLGLTTVTWNIEPIVEKTGKADGIGNKLIANFGYLRSGHEEQMERIGFV